MVGVIQFWLKQLSRKKDVFIGRESYFYLTQSFVLSLFKIYLKECLEAKRKIETVIKVDSQFVIIWREV